MGILIELLNSIDFLKSSSVRFELLSEEFTMLPRIITDSFLGFVESFLIGVLPEILEF